MAATLSKFYTNLSTTSRETQRKKIYQWLAKKDHIAGMVSTTGTAKQRSWRRLGAGTTLSPETEEMLVRWVNDMRKDGVPVTHAMHQLMALEAAVDEGYSEHEFKAGWHWMVGFKRRHKLSLRARTRDSNEDGIATRQEFSQHVRDLMGEHGVDVVYNADQTAVNYEYLPTKRINDIGEKTVWVKCGGKTKERVTAMVLANSAGTKHPLFLILRTTKSKVKAVVQDNLVERQGFGKRLWESVEPMDAKFNCRVYGNPTAWWNGSISLSFLEFHFSERPDRDTKPVLLLWDDFSAHWTEEVVAYASSINTVVVMALEDNEDTVQSPGPIANYSGLVDYVCLD
ncbi:hypothetical protein DYB28_002775 [Aphanomyces astaci]|uniref:HTH CENPB-type domain-containing protein n=1 Tax=Aphanomyces astaci TaxID=112090 RepID=A0A9X8DKF9_APHAT|nr:hypothetical protein DYB28_002775 [Aphanomyces astaci]